MYAHEEELAHLGKTYNDLPKPIKTAISFWQRQAAKNADIPADNVAEKKEAERLLKIKSVAIADDITAWGEKNLPDEETIKTENSMLTGDQLARAQAVGLTEAATMADVEAAELAAKEKADKEAADAATAAAKKEADDKEAADAAAKKAADDQAAIDAAVKKEADDKEASAAAAKKKVEEEEDEDIFDELGL